MVGMAGDAAGAEVAILLYEGCQAAMVHGMTDLLTIASRFSTARDGRPLRVTHWSLGEAGMRRVHDTLPRPGDPDVVVIPGRLSGPVERDEAASYAGWIRHRHAAGTILSASCGGVFMLAATGLLDGRPATTHWQFADVFRREFPQVRLDPGKMVVEDHDLITAGGLMAWTDLGMRLVERLLGPTVMIETARFLLIDPSGREQRHYGSFAPFLAHGDAAILKVQHWLHTQDASVASVRDMAARAGLEERTFLRRFKAASGMTPTAYRQQLRIGRARELLESTRRPVDDVAWAVGYGDPAAFRRLFQRIVGLSPGAYRARFSVARPAGTIS